jgi:hypothetical protein
LLSKGLSPQEIAMPTNPLVDGSPAETLRRCRLVLDYLIHVERPFASPDLEEGESLVLAMVRDALAADRIAPADC